MALVDIFVFLAGIALGGFIVWKYKSNIQTDMTKVNQTVAAAKTTASTVVTDIKKV